MGNSSLYILLAFDAFNKTEVTQLKAPMDSVQDFFALLYLAEMRIAVFCVVISIMLLGISFLFRTKLDDISKNKTWLIRIVLTAILIFGIGGIIDTVWQASI